MPHGLLQIEGTVVGAVWWEFHILNVFDGAALPLIVSLLVPILSVCPRSTVGRNVD